MSQVHFQSRLHIVSWLEKNCPRKAIVRALSEGSVEFYGGFSPVPPTTDPGWIMRVTSVYDKTWYVAVISSQNHYGIRILRDVPWGYWYGTYKWPVCYKNDNKFRQQLYSGDHPEEYLKLKEIWNENQHI